jgi:transcriptional regulator with XRE-family HTH domain
MTVKKRLTKSRMPFADSEIAKYLTIQINALSGVKNQRQIASEIGYEQANIISMFKRGETKIPFEKIPALAKALDADPSHLFRLALKQYWPDLEETISQIFGRLATKNEEEILLRKWREETKNMDPSSKETFEKGIDKMFAEALNRRRIFEDDAPPARFVDLNFKVPQKLHRRFRMEASARGLTMKELLIASFRAYLDANGGTIERVADDLISGRG